MIYFYADNFTDGNQKQAKLIIEHKNDYVRTKEISTISFYIGFLVLIIPLNCYFIWSKDPPNIGGI